VAVRILNGYEELTYDALQRACSGDGAHVFPKVRVADVFPLENQTISPKHLSYALKAHFDFVVTDKDYRPLFCVEFDGPLHETSAKQQERDRLKNEICDHFEHSLLRINSRYLTPSYRGMDLLTYFVDAWFLERAFSDAQANGFVPYDEPFDVTYIYSTGTEGRRKWPYWLSLDIQVSMEKLHKEGRIGQMVPSSYVGSDDDGSYRCLSWLVLDAGSVLAVKTGMRAQRFPAVMESDVLSMLAMFDLNELLQKTLAGDRSAVRDRKTFFSTTLKEFEKSYTMWSTTSCGATV
jgi:hypothetical protein